MPEPSLLALPKVLLHDHLDGGLSPQTIVHLGKTQGILLPDRLETAEDVAGWLKVTPEMPMSEVFRRFDLPTSLMQTRLGITHVIENAVADYSDDNIIYAEPRFAPQQHTSQLELDEVIECATTAFKTSGLKGGLILCAMRQKRDTAKLVDAAIRRKNDGVTGVDLAGPEPGEPLSPHREDFERAKTAGLGVTLHAAEMVGPKAILEVLGAGFTDRIGHGVWIIKDCTIEENEIIEFGPIAKALLEAGTTLEICVSSNQAVGIDPKKHPVGLLHRAGFNLCINTDNRIGKRHALTDEYRQLSKTHKFTAKDFRAMNTAAVAAAYTSPLMRSGLTEQIQAPLQD